MSSVAVVGAGYTTPGLRARPGDEELLAVPAGRLHFAGEHTAGPWAGLMEGAGQRHPRSE